MINKKTYEALLQYKIDCENILYNEFRFESMKDNINRMNSLSSLLKDFTEEVFELAIKHDVIPKNLNDCF